MDKKPVEEIYTHNNLLFLEPSIDECFVVDISKISLVTRYGGTVNIYTGNIPCTMENMSDAEYRLILKLIGLSKE
jgi:hypothetical protein